MKLEESKTPIKEQIELDDKKIKKLEKRQNYLEKLCEENKEEIRKAKESIALEKIDLQNQIKMISDDIEKMQQSNCKPELKKNAENKSEASKPNEEMAIFLKTLIKKKERALECPVCFEQAKIPIFMCTLSHLICKACKLKTIICPICRMEYPNEPIRNRYAEEDAEELSDLYTKIEALERRT